MAEKQKVEKTAAATAVFTKEAILRDKQYVAYLDVLAAQLDDGKGYTLGDVDKAIKAFMEREVK